MIFTFRTRTSILEQSNSPHHYNRRSSVEHAKQKALLEQRRRQMQYRRATISTESDLWSARNSITEERQVC